MKKMILVSIFIIFLLLLIFLPKLQRKNSQVNETIPEEKTEVIKYKQTYIPKESKSGECWTISSAATSNDKAWRCFVGDFIYDPCFETESKQLVCSVDPESAESGFELKLTKALSERSKYSKDEASKWSWVVKLQNGLTCEAMTGAADMIAINGEPYYTIYYACNQENVVLLDYLDKSSQPWKATVAYLSDDHEQIIKLEVINIVKAWE